MTNLTAKQRLILDQLRANETSTCQLDPKVHVQELARIRRIEDIFKACKKQNMRCLCVYCGHRYNLGHPTRKELMNHIRSCKTHPLREQLRGVKKEKSAATQRSKPRRKKP